MGEIDFNMEDIVIRNALPEEWDNAMELAFRVFLGFEARDYGKKGTEAFAEFVTSEQLKKLFLTGHYNVFVAVKNDKIVGVASIRNINHISLLFVDGNYHYRGIASELIKYMEDYLKDTTEVTYMTVNSSPYAVGFYHRLGFKDTGLQTEEDNIIYTPMKKDI